MRPPPQRTQSVGRATAVALVAVVALIWVTVPGWAQTSPAAITLRPQCGGPGSAIEVMGAEFSPFTAVLVTFDAGPGGRPESFPARTDGFGRFRLEIRPSGRPDGNHTVRADDFKQREATAVFAIPCPPEDERSTTTMSPPASGPTTTTSVPPPPAPPSLALEPPLAPPGFVTHAVGKGFPPGAEIELAWRLPEGDPFPARLVTADGAGEFRAPVLIFHRAALGPRQMTAVPAGGETVGDGPPPSAEAAFLVVPASAQPRDFRNRR